MPTEDTTETGNNLGQLARGPADRKPEVLERHRTLHIARPRPTEIDAVQNLRERGNSRHAYPLKVPTEITGDDNMTTPNRSPASTGMANTTSKHITGWRIR